MPGRFFTNILEIWNLPAYPDVSALLDWSNDWRAVSKSPQKDKPCVGSERAPASFEKSEGSMRSCPSSRAAFLLILLQALPGDSVLNYNEYAVPLQHLSEA